MPRRLLKIPGRLVMFCRYLHARRVTISFLVLVLVMCVVLASFVWVISGNRTNARQGKQAHDALCIVRVKIERGVRKAQEFLREHPNGISGIPATLIRSGINDDLGTLRGLNLLECVPPPKPKETP